MSRRPRDSIHRQVVLMQATQHRIAPSLHPSIHRLSQCQMTCRPNLPCVHHHRYDSFHTRTRRSLPAVDIQFLPFRYPRFVPSSLSLPSPAAFHVSTETRLPQGDFGWSKTSPALLPLPVPAAGQLHPGSPRRLHRRSYRPFPRSSSRAATPHPHTCPLPNRDGH